MLLSEQLQCRRVGLEEVGDLLESSFLREPFLLLRCLSVSMLNLASMFRCFEVIWKCPGFSLGWSFGYTWISRVTGRRYVALDLVDIASVHDICGVQVNNE